MFKKGDQVKISKDGLKIHSQSIPAHVGYSQDTMNWIGKLSKFQRENSIGEIERTFPNSTHINVIFNAQCYGVDETMLELITPTDINLN